MQPSHSVSAVFDDPNLVSVAGLVPVLGLARRAGLCVVPTSSGQRWRRQAAGQSRRRSHRTPAGRAAGPRRRSRSPRTGSAARRTTRSRRSSHGQLGFGIVLGEHVEGPFTDCCAAKMRVMEGRSVVGADRDRLQGGPLLARPAEFPRASTPLCSEQTTPVAATVPVSTSMVRLISSSACRAGASSSPTAWQNRASFSGRASRPPWVPPRRSAIWRISASRYARADVGPCCCWSSPMG